MTKKTRKRVLFLCGYAVFNFFLVAVCLRILARMGAVFGLLHFSMGDVLNNLLASLLPGPF